MKFRDLFHVYRSPDPEPAPVPSPAPAPSPDPSPSPSPDPSPSPAPAPAPAPSPSPEPKAIWPDDWRHQMASGNADALKTLERFATPGDVYKSYAELRGKVSSGELKHATPFPEKGTPEEQATWRQQNGIPESPEKYDITLGDGLVIGDEDKPIIDTFLKEAHAANASNAYVKSSLKWYYNELKRQQEALAVSDAQAKEKFEETMRPQWGAEYKQNLNRVHALLDTGGKDLKNLFLGGRLADGSPIGSNVEMLSFLAGVAVQLNPVSTIVPGGGEGQMNVINDEIAKFDKMMGDRSSEYWKGPNAEKNQERYRQLVAARDKLSGKAA